MFAQFGTTSENLSKASTMVFRIGTDAHLYDDPDDVSIAPLLDSKFDSEKYEALKRLLALIAQGVEVSSYFPQVVKNVASQSLEVKKLVYLYLLHYAEKRPNEALLSINCFQKDLGDPNPLVRAWALRAMAGIRLHAIAPLVLVAVGKCARDPSVYVRKCAANALLKLHDLRMEENGSAIEEIIGTLLNDNSPGVVGAAAAAFSSICPNNLSLISKSYKRLCQTLPDVEDWGQIALIGILLRYVIARHGLVKESIMISSCSNYHNTEISDSGMHNGNLSTEIIDDGKLASAVSKSYLEGPDKFLSQSTCVATGSSGFDFSLFTSARGDDDVEILLQCTSPLLWSQNSAVVLAAASVQWIMAPREDIRRIVKPLLFLLRSSDASKYVVLCNIQVFAKAMPSLFASYFDDFFVSSSDACQIKALKLEILSSVATESSISLIFQELQDYVQDVDRRFAADTVAAIGLCAQRLPKVANTCLEGLLALATPKSLNREFGSVDEEVVLVQAIASIKAIIKLDPPSHDKVIVRLIRGLDVIKVPAARATIIWIVGEYNSIGHIIPKMTVTILKYLTYCFTSEPVEVKLQILNAAFKVTLCAKNSKDLFTLKRLLSFVLELAKCDLNYDIRDRGRVLKNLLCNMGFQGLEEEAYDKGDNFDKPWVLAENIFREQSSSKSTETINYRFHLPGSLSQIVLHAAPGYEPLPEPCSLASSNGVQGMESGEEATHTDSDGENYNESDSGSLEEESTHTDDSQESVCSSGSPLREVEESTGSFISFSDIGKTQNQHEDSEGLRFGSSDLGELMSKRALESWLDESPGLSQDVVGPSSQRNSWARISLVDINEKIRPNRRALLDPANGDGLKVDYTFSLEISNVSPELVSIEASFKNCSAEPLSTIFFSNEDSSRSSDSSDQAYSAGESTLTRHKDVPVLVPMEEIDTLEPGHTTKRLLQVHFHHHLLPLKLILHCNDKKHPVKLRPDIGYFVKPLPMDSEMFSTKESHLPGMFEYSRRCSFTDHVGVWNNKKGEIKDTFVVVCETLALKMLSNANLFLVSVELPVATDIDSAAGLCIRFSSEIISNSLPCLITVALEGKCSEPLDALVKVNCEETVFGLNFLNRVVNFLAEPPLSC